MLRVAFHVVLWPCKQRQRNEQRILWNWRMIIAVNFTTPAIRKPKKPKKIRASTGSESVTSAAPVRSRCSTNWDWERGQLIEFISSPWGVKWCEVYMNKSIHEIIHIWTAVGHGLESRWSPDFFQSSRQLLKLEILLQWSFFTFIHNRSSDMNYFIYTSHQRILCDNQINAAATRTSPNKRFNEQNNSRARAL